MCQLLSGIYLENGDIKLPIFFNSHTDIIEYYGLTKQDREFNLVKFEITPPWKLVGFFNAQKWNFKIDQDILPDWANKKFVENEVRNKLQTILDDENYCPKIEKTCNLLWGRFLALRGIGTVKKLIENTLILFLPTKITIENAGYAQIQNVGYAKIEYAGSAIIQNAGFATIQNAGSATIQYTSYATITK